MIAAQAGTNWPEAAIAIAGIAFVTIVSVVVVAQLAASWRARMLAAREDSYRKLAEEASEINRRSADGLERTATELIELRTRTAELERMLKEID